MVMSCDNAPSGSAATARLRTPPWRYMLSGSVVRTGLDVSSKVMLSSFSPAYSVEQWRVTVVGVDA